MEKIEKKREGLKSSKEEDFFQKQLDQYANAFKGRPDLNTTKYPSVHPSLHKSVSSDHRKVPPSPKTVPSSNKKLPTYHKIVVSTENKGTNHGHNHPRIVPLKLVNRAHPSGGYNVTKYVEETPRLDLRNSRRYKHNKNRIVGHVDESATDRGRLAYGDTLGNSWNEKSRGQRMGGRGIRPGSATKRSAAQFPSTKSQSPNGNRSNSSLGSSGWSRSLQSPERLSFARRVSSLAQNRLKSVSVEHYSDVSGSNSGPALSNPKFPSYSYRRSSLAPNTRRSPPSQAYPGGVGKGSGSVSRGRKDKRGSAYPALTSLASRRPLSQSVRPTPRQERSRRSGSLSSVGSSGRGSKRDSFSSLLSASSLALSDRSSQSQNRMRVSGSGGSVERRGRKSTGSSFRSTRPSFVVRKYSFDPSGRGSKSRESSRRSESRRSNGSRGRKSSMIDSMLSSVASRRSSLAQPIRQSKSQVPRRRSSSVKRNGSVKRSGSVKRRGSIGRKIPRVTGGSRLSRNAFRGSLLSQMIHRSKSKGRNRRCSTSPWGSRPGGSPNCPCSPGLSRYVARSSVLAGIIGRSKSKERDRCGYCGSSGSSCGSRLSPRGSLSPDTKRLSRRNTPGIVTRMSRTRKRHSSSTSGSNVSLMTGRSENDSLERCSCDRGSVSSRGSISSTTQYRQSLKQVQNGDNPTLCLSRRRQSSSYNKGGALLDMSFGEFKHDGEALSVTDWDMEIIDKLKVRHDHWNQE